MKMSCHQVPTWPQVSLKIRSAVGVAQTYICRHCMLTSSKILVQGYCSWLCIHKSLGVKPHTIVTCSPALHCCVKGLFCDGPPTSLCTYTDHKDSFLCLIVVYKFELFPSSRATGTIYARLWSLQDPPTEVLRQLRGRALNVGSRLSNHTHMHTKQVFILVALPCLSLTLLFIMQFLQYTTVHT